MVDLFVRDELSVEADLASGRLLKPGQAAKKCRFAAAGRADQDEHVALIDVKIDLVQDLDLPVFLLKADFQILNVDHFVSASSQRFPGAR